MRRFFVLPSSAIHDDQAVIAWLVKIITAGLLAVSLGFFVPVVLVEPTLGGRYTVLTVVTALACGGVLALNRRGHARFAAGVLVGFLWLLVTVSMAGAGGIGAPIFTGYFIVVLLGGLLFGPRAGLALTIASIGSGAAVVWAVEQGYLAVAAAYNLPTRLILVGFFLTLLAIVQALASYTTRLALKQARQELAQRRESEVRFRTFVEQSLEGLVMTDEQGIVIEWNQAQERLTGRTRAETIGLPLWAVQITTLESDKRTPAYEEGIRASILTALQTGAAPFLGVAQERTIRRRDGTTAALQHTPFRIKTDQGYRLGSTTRDITERKQAEAEREQLIAELEAKNAELEAKNAELERFTYTVSHDLKSPLITINGFLGFIEQDVLAGNAHRLTADIRRITDAVAKMRRLLDELLELSRIGRLMNPPTHIPFAAVVHEALALVRGRLAARGVAVEVAPELPAVYGDRMRLVEVVQNLVDNAAKFMGEQPAPRIWIGAREQGGETVCYVRDNGIGIDPRYHQKVFGLFDKLDASSEGTGIGLALVKRIVEVHGGRIWVESEVGQGATFCFTLARAPAATP